MMEDYRQYNKEFFKTWAPLYDIFTTPFSSVRKKVANMIGADRGSKVLDVCAGTGAQTFAFGRNGCEVTGIDISADMLRIAEKKNRYKNVSFKVADATNMPFADNSFNISCISFALHDMPYEIRHIVIDEMIRVGRKSVFIDYYLPKNRVNRWFRVFFISLYESKYFRDYAKYSLMQLLQQHDLRVIKRTYGLVNFAEIMICERK